VYAVFCEKAVRTIRFTTWGMVAERPKQRRVPRKNKKTGTCTREAKTKHEDIEKDRCPTLEGT